MAYVVLARKWRPRRFEDVVGQEHITDTLASAITQGRVAHGYLFCGPRGVGKTTVARILAKALNCEKGPTATPCNVCTSCLDADMGRTLDIIEVDGASTRGIDDVRELRENVRYAPTGGRTKVYIIDEVHMLTREAFNALLKTLEEPPPHVVFVMATTEPFKVPATILSRCQRFDFARIHPRAVVDQLQRIVEAEGFRVQTDALALLARRSQGGLRDALSTLDQVIASADGEITLEMVIKVLGILGSDFYLRLTDHLLAGETKEALALLDEVYQSGADLAELTEELARHLRNLMILSSGPGMESVLSELGPAEVARLREQADRVSPPTAGRLLETALRAVNQARRSDHLRLHLELALVELAAAARAVPIGEIARRLEELERRLSGSDPGPGSGGSDGGASRGASRGSQAAGQAATPARDGGGLGGRRTKSPAGETGDAAPEASAGGAVALAGAPATGGIAALWERVVEEVKKRKMAVGAFLMGSRAAALDAEGRLVVQVDQAHATFKAHLEEDATRRFIEGVIREVFGRTVHFRLVVGAEAALAAAPAPIAAAAPNAVPDEDARPVAPAEPAAALGPPEPEARPRKSPLEIARTDRTVLRVIELFDGEIAP